MFRPAALFLIFVLLAGPAAAVDWAVGLNAVGTNNSFTGDLPDDGSWESKSSLGGGAIFDLELTSEIALSLQPTWITRGSAQIDRKNGIVLARADYDLTYFSLPLLVRVASDPGRVRGFVTAGLVPAYLLDATLEFEGVTEDIQQDFRDFTLGALFGAGALIDAWGQQLILEFRYEQGLEDIVDRDDQTVGSIEAVESVKYRELKFCVGVLFGAGGDR
jgi:hypothetical protein